MTRVDHLTRDLGVTLTDHLAPLAWDAFDLLRHEERACDGWPARGESAGRGGAASSTTEGAVLAGAHVAADLAELLAAREDIHRAVKVYGHLLQRYATPAAIRAKRCGDGQFGRDAGAWSDDLACRKIPDKAGLCQRHYSAWRRYREKHGVDTSGDFEPGAA